MNVLTEIDHALKNNSDIIFITYSMLDDTNKRIQYTLEKILNRYNKEEWIIPVHSAIKELITNALKANVKKILIDEGIIKKTDSLYDEIYKLRTILNEKAILQYGVKVKAKALSTRIYFKFNADKLIVQVINNLPLSETEYRKINEKISITSKYDSIAEYYLNYQESECEGMGLGICMVQSLLKNIYLDCSNFSFTTDGVEKTCAQITIPLY